jgi:hypothetical protein
VTQLTREELALLRLIREADVDHGGLLESEMSEDESSCARGLLERGLVEALGEYGEAPDGEEDEKDSGGALTFRITGLGVAHLRDP